MRVASFFKEPYSFKGATSSLTAIRHNEPLNLSFLPHTFLLLPRAVLYTIIFYPNFLVGPKFLVQHAMVLNHIHGDMGSCLPSVHYPVPHFPLFFSCFFSVDFLQTLQVDFDHPRDGLLGVLVQTWHFRTCPSFFWRSLASYWIPLEM
jgi:hypothetical protein